MTGVEGERSAWISLEQASRRYELGLRTLERWIKDGWFTENNGLRRLGSRTVRVDPAAFEKNPPHKPKGEG